MSFLKSLKGLADDLKDMISDKDKEKKDEKPVSAHPESGDHDRGYAGYRDPNAQQHYNDGQQTYNQSAYPQQHQYQQGPPPNQGYGPAPQGSSLPHGWIQQWDQNSQRYYYLEQATGRTQWEPPASHDRGFEAPPPPQGQNYQYHGGYQQGYGGYGYGASTSAIHPGGQNYSHEAVKAGETHKSSNKNAILAGAGGLALGGIAGAALAGDSSDDEHHTSAPRAGYGAPSTGYGAAPADYGAQSGYGAQPGYGASPPPPMDDPQALEHNSDVSSSQRSSLEEARHEYEEAQRKAADSNASSSDHEEAEEARQEYQEEIEEARSDAED